MIILRDLNEVELLDLLSDCTTHYTHMLNVNDKSREFYEYKRMIEKITDEISNRRETDKRHPPINGFKR